jgi:hypothetical protein
MPLLNKEQKDATKLIVALKLVSKKNLSGIFHHFIFELI